MKTVAICLIYEEPGWMQRTMACLAEEKLPVVLANRDGVGNMSRAFNAAAKAALEQYPDTGYLFFVTNIGFTPGIVNAMESVMNGRPDVAALHPRHNSDHPHICNAVQPTEVPFIEWTAPFVRASAWKRVGGLNEAMPYWGMDLDWSYRAKAMGYSLLAIPEMVTHVYLRHNAPYPISKIRAELRKLYDQPTIDELTRLYGPEWKKTVWV